MNTSAPPASVVVDDPVTSSPSDAPRRDRDRFVGTWRSGWTWSAAVVVTFCRWLEAADRRVFHVAPDEPGQLAMARWLSGGTRWNMFDHLTWRPGYALTIAPLARVFGGGEALVRATLTLNAVFAGLSCVCLVVLLRRWTDLSPRGAAAAAVGVALAPAVIASSAYTWAESLITLVFLATLVALQGLVDHRRLRYGVAAIVLAAFAMTVHGRSLPMLPVTAAVVAVVLLADRRWTHAAATTGLAAALGVASLRFTEWVLHSVWDDPSDVNTADTLISRLGAPQALLDSFVGQTWYQLVASAGLVGLGVGVVALALVRPTGPMRRVDAAILTVVTLPLVLTSVTFMAGQDRPDQLVYGRYVDAVSWPLVGLGAAWTIRRLRPIASPGRSWLPSVVAIVCVVTGVVVAFRHGDVLAADVGLRMMVPGLLPYIGSGDGVPVLTITAIVTMWLGALALVIGLANPRRVPSGVIVVVAALVLTGAAVRVHDAQATYLNTWAIGDDLAEVDALLPPDESVGVVMRREAFTPSYVEQRQRFAVYQLFLPDHEFVWERTPGRYRTRFVMAPTRVPALRDAGYSIVWYDPVKPMALWERTDD